MPSKLMMLKSEKTRVQSGAKAPHFTTAAPLWSAARWRRCGQFSCLLLIAFFAGCRYDMQDQPKMKPFRGTTFFSDGLSGRQPIEGTIPRGFLRSDTEFYTGKKSGTGTANAQANTQSGQQIQGQQGQAAPGTNQADPYAGAVDTFPFPITKEIVVRGRERYDIFCSVCHGLTGNGDGMIVRRGYRRAASFNDDRLRQAPVGHFFDAITNGWGAMPSYNAQISVQDRWAIIAYIRALQASQQNAANPLRSPSPTASPTPGGRE